jgi:uncharacterized protein with NAD-binding domain and iron-sulfur cluster
LDRLGKRRHNIVKEGQDFDLIVLGIPISALPSISGELIAANNRWAAMTDRVATIQTQGFQVWLKPDLSQSGWTLPSPILGAYVEPLSTWADMTHLLPMEGWSADDRPGQLAYFVGGMPDNAEIPGPEVHEFPARESLRAKNAAIDFLTKNITYLLPRTTDPLTGLFNWDALIAPADSKGPDRFNAQYWRANIDPSERYVLAVAGSTPFRLKTDESGFNNLLLTGDWIRNGLNTSGCIESAVISGRQAGRAAQGANYTIIGESDLL